jgi:hypothetical protein
MALTGQQPAPDTSLGYLSPAVYELQQNSIKELATAAYPRVHYFGDAQLVTATFRGVLEPLW